MAQHFDFEISCRYETTEVGVTIPVSLTVAVRTVEAEAKVDTGAEFCFFQRELADRLNLEVESGSPILIRTLAGLLTAYAHRVTIQTLGLAFESTVLFNSAYGTTRNILGRKGWLEHLHLGLTIRDETIYLSPVIPRENP